VLSSIPYAGKDTSLVREPDPKICGCAKSIYEHGETVNTPAAAAT
jgi:hypothetical protein